MTNEDATPQSSQNVSNASIIMSKLGFIKSTTIAVIDQAWLSGLNFFIGLAFINFSTKTDYGVYVQLFAVLLLFSSVQNALIFSPMTALAPKKTDDEQRVLVKGLFWFQGFEVAGLALLAFCVLWFSAINGWFPSLDYKIALPFALALFGLGLREFQRSFSFLLFDPLKVFFLDVFYGILLVVILFWVFSSNEKSFSVVDVFWCIGLANILSTLLFIIKTDKNLLKPDGFSLKAINEAWTCGRWALPGVIVTWGFSNTYVYIAAIFVGVEATADIAAARLFLMPIGMTVLAWSKIFQPRASRWFGEKKWRQIERVAINSTACFALLLGAYVCAILTGFGWLESHILKSEYQGLNILIICWAGVFFVSGIRQVGTSSLIAATRFRELFIFSLISFICSVPLLISMTLSMGGVGLITGLIFIELLLAMLIWYWGWQPLKRLYI